MTCYQHMFANDADHPHSSLCDCGKRYEEHPIDTDYVNEKLAEEQMQDLEMECGYIPIYREDGESFLEAVMNLDHVKDTKTQYFTITEKHKNERHFTLNKKLIETINDFIWNGTPKQAKMTDAEFLEYIFNFHIEKVIPIITDQTIEYDQNGEKTFSFINHLLGNNNTQLLVDKLTNFIQDPCKSTKIAMIKLLELLVEDVKNRRKLSI